MQDKLDDSAKMRLTERDDIEAAIGVLKERGYDLDKMVGELTRLFYLDLDEFNQVVRPN